MSTTYDDRVRSCIARLESVYQQLNHNGNYLVPRDLIAECCDCLYEFLDHPDPLGGGPEDYLLR